MSAFTRWTCIFPGKGSISWKRAWDGVGTKEEAETEARKHCNVVAVPLQLWEHHLALEALAREGYVSKSAAHS